MSVSTPVSKNVALRWRWALPAVAVVALGGCSSAEQNAVDDFEREAEAGLGEGAQVEIDPGGDGFSVDFDGVQFAEGSALDRPDWLLADIPLPSDLKITSTLVREQFRSLRGTTDVSPDDLGELYESAFAAVGYDIEQPWDVSNPFALKARTPDGDPITIEYTPEEFALVLGRE